MGLYTIVNFDMKQVMYSKQLRNPRISFSILGNGISSIALTQFPEATHIPAAFPKWLIRH